MDSIHTAARRYKSDNLIIEGKKKQVYEVADDQTSFTLVSKDRITVSEGVKSHNLEEDIF
ncbi:hypothetical protein PV327_010196 [Microctonus hyperodae]|uniref:SAICAR synthetase/ADE2 N-terminal domain-containing protein n=1 Tax=Microctonus hyperodae TaxID=165561 RepID=A0AA39FRE1_MICHY|nr:hypothetical protein PV327_010196 [Microctonus hyperodae]